LDQKYKDMMGYEFENKMKILLTAYMDDVTIICADVKSAQILYTEFERLCKMLGLSIGKSKCAIMTLNDEDNFDDEIIKVDIFKYLGEYLSTDGTSGESYIFFMKMLNMRLKSLDNKSWDKTIKSQKFKEEILPWIQRKTLLMYDISNEQRLKIVAVLKPYTEKWDIVEYEIFTDAVTIINNSEDSIIKEIKDTELNENLEHDIEIANYVYSNTDIKFKYSQVDEEFALALELENLEEYTEK